MSGYIQLTQEERYQIYILKKAEYSQGQIAELLERDKSTISRELWRNRGLKGYRPQQAHNLALMRRYNKAQPRIGSQVWQQVEALIREQWSPEHISHEFQAWAKQQGIKLLCIQPGKPTQNAYVERFNRTVRHEWLNEHLFESIEHAQETAAEWLWRYNAERPHMALGGITPYQKLAMVA